jgi:hypothetical protein
MSSTRCVLDVSTSRFVLLLGSCASSWRAPRASSWRAPRERASMKNDGMMIIIIGARGRVFGFATKPSTSLAVARRPVHSRVPTRLTSQPAHAAVYTIYFYSDFNSIRTQYLAAISFYIHIRRVSAQGQACSACSLERSPSAALATATMPSRQ